MYENLGSVYLLGDFNSRVGSKKDFIIYDKMNSVTDDTNYIADSIPCRATIDSKHNNYGIKLLDLCKSSSMRIINGRIGKTDTFTFFFIS